MNKLIISFFDVNFKFHSIFLVCVGRMTRVELAFVNVKKLPAEFHPQRIPDPKRSGTSLGYFILYYSRISVT